MTDGGVRLVCHGCGAAVAAGAPLVFRCPAGGGDDVDHVLEVELDLGGGAFPPDGPSDDPYVRYADLLFAVRDARARGRTAAEIAAATQRLGEAVAGVDGRGFVETPYGAADGGPELPGLWVKHESRGVAGSHKARHLFPVALLLELAGVPRERPLAIASCGNAALAAAVVARAAGRPLEVFVPVLAPPAVTDRLAELGATVTRVARAAGGAPGDPCMHAFRAAVAAGALPFSVQGSENGPAVEGARTIAWEIVSAHRRGGAALPDHVVVQVGGGALLSGLAAGFEVARALGAVDRTPRFHAVQAAGGAPFVEACDRLGDGGPDAFRTAARARSRFMRPWPIPPRSVARGILDDETYDWLAGARAVLSSGGRALTVTDDELLAATERASRLSDVPVCETAAAGLAGAVRLAGEGAFADGDRVAVLFTGRRR